jgi:hypothetical protein
VVDSIAQDCFFVLREPKNYPKDVTAIGLWCLDFITFFFDISNMLPHNKFRCTTNRFAVWYAVLPANKFMVFGAARVHSTCGLCNGRGFIAAAMLFVLLAIAGSCSFNEETRPADFDFLLFEMPAGSKTSLVEYPSQWCCTPILFF